MKLIHIVFLLLFGSMLTACAATDPSVNDIKSPCVSNGKGATDPCMRRTPIDNYIA